MPTIDIQRVGATAVLTLNRPEQRNALDYAMREELDHFARTTQSPAQG